MKKLCFCLLFCLIIIQSGYTQNSPLQIENKGNDFEIVERENGVDLIFTIGISVPSDAASITVDLGTRPEMADILSSTFFISHQDSTYMLNSGEIFSGNEVSIKIPLTQSQWDIFISARIYITDKNGLKSEPVRISKLKTDF